MSDENSYEIKNELPNLYKLLGLTIDVCKEENCDEIIQKAYSKGARIYHPDKNRGRKDCAEIFELITGAYEILKDPVQRNKYNNKLKLQSQCSNDFFKLREESKKYYKSVGEVKPPSEDQLLAFDANMKNLDNKNSYNRDDVHCKEIPLELAVSKLSELSKKREKQSNKYKPERLFDDGNFNLKKFNAAFDIAKKHETKSDNSLVEHAGVPLAWNDYDSGIGYCDFDELDNLYVNNGNRLDISRQNFSSIDFDEPVKLRRDDISDLEEAAYVSDHNKLEEDYYKNLEQKLHERANDSNQFQNSGYYSKTDTAGYGIFDQLGYEFDEDDVLNDDIDDDITSRYEKLLLERNNDLLQKSD